MDTQKLKTTCCIAGGGPAGMMLGFLLARAGVNVLVLEKHVDFLRDFRGDTIHPSTLQLMHELGVLEKFLQRPHQEVRELRAYIGGTEVIIGDFSHLPTVCRFVALMPQWDFLNFIAEEAKAYPGFQLKMKWEAIGLIEQENRILGVRVRTQEGDFEVTADLVVAADGRGSILRKCAQLEPTTFGAPMDVLWMRLSKKPGDPGQVFGRIESGHFIVLLDRGDYWQCAFVIPKGALDEIRANGLENFRKTIETTVPFLEGRGKEIQSWDDVKLLTVMVDRLPTWYRPGLLCIGDAAHAMSPIGGVGINLAIQDAVAAANLLWKPLKERTLNIEDLEKVQKRREFPTRMTQKLQIFLQNRFVSRILENKNEPLKVPLFAKLLNRFPLLRRIPARLVGIGFRPEHIKNSDFRMGN